MKPAKPILISVIGLALMSSGCAYLRPPAEDKETWELQQKHEEAQKESAMEKDQLAMSLYWTTVLGEFSAALAGVK
jgi:hypothetical protein